MESTANVNDLLGFRNEADVFGKLLDGEEIIFSCYVKKKNRIGWVQKRILLLTNIRLHNVEGKELKRSIELASIKALTKNIENGHTNEFIVHVKDEYDYELITEDRELILKFIMEAHKETKRPEIPIFGVNGKLSHYLTTKKDLKAKQIRGLPPDMYRLTGTDAVNADSATWSAHAMPEAKDGAEKKEKPKKEKKVKAPKPSKGGYVPPPP